jgi:hypothetical protein
VRLNKTYKEWQNFLLEIVNHDPGGCLCGHAESCEVCSRSQGTRRAERSRKETALRILRASGVKLKRIKPKFLMDIERYKIL